MSVTCQPESISIPYLPESAKVYRYENGYTFIYVPKKGDVFNVSTWVKTGSIHEDAQNNGVSHFLEHLMFKGTERFAVGVFDRTMESMGAVINAATWKDYTFYYVTGPKGSSDPAELGQNFETALDMHADMLLFSTLPDAEIGPQYDPEDSEYAGEKRERSVVIEEIGMREDQPWTKVFNTVNEMMYASGHPYQRDVIGTRQIIGNIPRESIEGYYTQWYSAPNMTTIIVGDFPEAALEAFVTRCFDFSRRPLPTPFKANLTLTDLPADVKAIPHETRYLEIPGEYQTSFFISAYHAPNPEDLTASIALDVASYVLGEARSSRLTQALLEKPSHPVFNSVSCGQSVFKLGNVFYIQGNFTAQTPEKPLAELRSEIEKMLETEPITQEEFDRAVKKLKVDFAETSETASGIADAIGESMTVVGDLSQYVNYLETLNRLDLATVRKVAKTILDPAKAYTSVLVPTVSLSAVS